MDTGISELFYYYCLTRSGFHLVLLIKNIIDAENNVCLFCDEDTFCGSSV